MVPSARGVLMENADTQTAFGQRQGAFPIEDDQVHQPELTNLDPNQAGTQKGTRVHQLELTNSNPNQPGPQIEIRQSSRRKKTASAYLEGGTIIVNLPAHLKAQEKDSMVEWLVNKVMARSDLSAKGDQYLSDLAQVLSRKYLEGVTANSIRWVTNQNSRWGSCTIATRDIRISSRLSVVPKWVLESVIVHELAHLIEPNHSLRFRDLVNRFPRTNDAAIYLDGFSRGAQYAHRPLTLETIN